MQDLVDFKTKRAIPEKKNVFKIPFAIAGKYSQPTIDVSFKGSEFLEGI